ncbi:HAD family hydrolase [Streptomyces sp. TP-A0874]|uniref:HAD family hydrolase n=1 Tax=Streptomyces sp. TP-A0874 TaxID=549819 RepID=UPI000852B3E9|nr:HAD-IA family hydrolase [Streptomyces sp. TP-A0874]
MTIEGVLFDFSGTLFHIEPAERWLRTALEREGVALSDEETARWTAALEDAGAQPGGAEPRRVPPHLRDGWANRDRRAEEHRATYIGLAREAALPWPRVYEALYERHSEPEAWLPYPDTQPVLRALSERGLPVGVVSNVGWDLRPVFRAHGLDGLVEAYTLSYEHGVQKPEPELFRLACATLGLAPERVLMVGDSQANDGAAVTVGCTVRLVRKEPPEARPAALLPMLDLVG